MHMDDPLHVRLEQCRRIDGTAVERVARVEEQPHARARHLHQPADVGGRFDIRTHVMVIGEREAVVLAQVVAELREPPAVGLPLRRVAELRPAVQRHFDSALDRARHFAVDDDLAAIDLQLCHVLVAARDLSGDIAVRQLARIPAGDARDAVLRQLGLQGGGSLGNLLPSSNPS
jgi:hypothetical protein